MITLTGYSEQISVRPGDRIAFKVSAEDGAAYTADIVRIRCGDTNPAGPGVSETVVDREIGGRHQGRRQVIRTGSCVVADWRPGIAVPESFSLTAMIWPTTPGDGRAQAIISFGSDGSEGGVTLGLDESGRITLWSGASVLAALGRPEKARQWVWVGATFDAASGVAVVFRQPLHPTHDSGATVEQNKVATVPQLEEAPMVIGARLAEVSNGRAVTRGHYNGKIDSPRLACRGLGMEALHVLQHTPLLIGGALLAAWDFARDIPTTTVRDTGANQLHGSTVNLPTRGVTGWNWTAAEMGWPNAPEEYGAIHFHDDDLYDAGWEDDFSYAVPMDLPSGVYAARLRGGADNDQEEYIPFYVRAPLAGPRSDVVFLAPTASYMAYSNFRVGLLGEGAETVCTRLITLQPQDMFLADHPEYGASLYDLHSDGSGVCYSSRLRPDLGMRPKTVRWDGMGSSYMRHFNADSHILDWLEAENFGYDVLTDEDLHREGLACLAPYRCVITGTHPEYYSTAMLDAVRAYSGAGGRLMYLGGNGFYWRIAFSDATPGAIEVRRSAGTRCWDSPAGESYLGFSGEAGGLWRLVGHPPQTLTGVGFAAMGFDRSSPYQRQPDSFDPRAAFIFEGIGADEIIGDFGLIGDGAAGLEIDRASLGLGTPDHALVLATSQWQHSTTYRLTLEDLTFNDPVASGADNGLVRSDLVFFETANGGGVFSVGSIAWCGALAHNGYDNNVSRLTGNVLRRFIQPEGL